MILESSLSTVKMNMILYACCFSFWCHVLKPQGLENVDKLEGSLEMRKYIQIREGFMWEMA